MYWDIADMAGDDDLVARLEAAAAQELPVGSAMSPQLWVATYGLRLTASPGWAPAWASAIAGNVDRPGKDPGVITDGMILSAVQSLIGAI